MEFGEINVELLSELLQNRRKQKGLSLREAAGEIGVSAPTLQRLEARQVPNTPTLLRISQWLGVPVADLNTTPKSEQKKDTIEQIEVLLRADPNLDKDAAATIANVARQVYDGFKRQKTKRVR
jgi:transcriptional regulator with XRE-family HTH domain